MSILLNVSERQDVVRYMFGYGFSKPGSTYSVALKSYLPSKLYVEGDRKRELGLIFRSFRCV
jgi:hypothetical protein